MVDTRGQNLYDLQDANGKVAIFELPKKLRHVVFIRPGTFVFSRPDVTRREGAVRGDIEVVILDCYLPAMRKSEFWPPAFALLSPSPAAKSVEAVPSSKGETSDVASPTSSGPTASVTNAEVAEDGAKSEDMDDVWAMGRNPNRASWAYYHASSSDEEGNSKEN